MRSTGEPYADGTPRLEIHVPTERSAGLPHCPGQRVPVRLRVAGAEYSAGLRSTTKNKYVWVSPTIMASGGAITRLGRVLADAGYSVNERVKLHVKGTSLELRRPEQA